MIAGYLGGNNIHTLFEAEGGAFHQALRLPEAVRPSLPNLIVIIPSTIQGIGILLLQST